MSMKVTIAKEGFDAKTTADDNLVFSSEWDSLKAAAVGVASVILPSASASVNLDITHSLGYAPAFFVLVQLSGGEFAPLPFANIFTDLSTRVASVSARSNTTRVRIGISGFAGGGDVTLTFKYYIFYNQLD